RLDCRACTPTTLSSLRRGWLSMTPSTAGLATRATKRTIGPPTSPGSRPLSGDLLERRHHETLSVPCIDFSCGPVHARNSGRNGLVLGRYDPHSQRSRL